MTFKSLIMQLANKSSKTHRIANSWYYLPFSKVVEFQPVYGISISKWILSKDKTARQVNATVDYGATKYSNLTVFGLLYPHTASSFPEMWFWN